MAQPAQKPYLPLDQILASVMDRLHTSPIRSSTLPRLPFSVAKLVGALVTHSPDPLDIAQELYSRLQGRTFGQAWAACLSSLVKETDQDTGLPVRIRADNETFETIAEAIRNNSSVQGTLARWANEYFGFLFLPMRQKPSRDSPSATSSDTMRDSNFRNRPLERDGPSCLLTGTVDLETKERVANEWMKDFAFDDDKAFRDTLQGAHIIPLSIAGHPLSHLILHRFSAKKIKVDELTDERLNAPDNGIMMERAAHAAFDSFRVSINYTNANGNDPKYNLCFVDTRMPPKSLDDCDDRLLRFGLWQTRHNNAVQHPLPNSDFLETHLALARVLHASGAGEVIDQIHRDEEDMKAGSGNLPTESTEPDSEQEESANGKWGPTALSYIDRRLGGFERGDISVSG